MKLESIVHIVEDDEAYQKAICLIVESVGLETRIYGSAREFLEKFEPDSGGRQECLVTDVRLPGMSGLDLQKNILENKITLPTVVISAHGDVPIAVEAIKTGAIDFIEKPFRQQKLLDAIQSALAESEAVQKRQSSGLELQQRMASLTVRQREVMDLMIDGKPNKIIADELGLSIKTVEQHRSLVMKNMKADSFAELVHLVLEIKRIQG